MVCTVLSMNSFPKIIFLISGKRKSGKDFVSELLFEKFGPDNAVIIRLSAPIKSYWAEHNGLQLEELLSSRQYKENHRKAMIAWSEEVRSTDYGYFCRAAVEMVQGAGNRPVWIVSDTRRLSDIKWFNENYSSAMIKCVRIISSEEVRKARGWVFVKGVDDAESECDLDEMDTWDVVFHNDNDDKEFKRQFTTLVDMCDHLFLK